MGYIEKFVVLCKLCFLIGHNFAKGQSGHLTLCKDKISETFSDTLEEAHMTLCTVGFVID
jgi:hypothetical protein